MSSVLYSVITPVYNRADCIVRCMESVSENYKQISRMGGGKIEHRIEHVVVDDGSTDGTKRLVGDYAASHGHVRFVDFAVNRGTNAARNAAISVAAGEWCVILDSDDYFVEDALRFIIGTMESHPGYRHYMFAPDDMQPYYRRNPIIKGAAQKVLLYPDFLNGYIGGDFIHVCHTEIVRRHPFDEKVRIHEGVFFLQFYREAQRMLFTNRVVAIRERNRRDSVTKTILRTNRAAAERTARSNELYLKYFEADLETLGMQRRLYAIRLNLLDNYVLTGKYREAGALARKIGKPQAWKDKMLRWCARLRCGGLYRISLKCFLVAKYKVLKTKMRI